MTDNEIIKAIEKCASIGESCKDCPFYEYTDCDKRLKECFHDMLNRQKAENEELRKGFIADVDYFASEYDFKIKSEAIKEFAEIIKGVVECDICLTENETDYLCLRIDEEAEELVGD